jgi:LL-H family phage holin
MNEMVNQLVFNVLLALIVALIGIVTKTLLPYLKAKQEAATTALRQTRWAWAADIVDAVVKAVEQTADEYMHGEVKKDTATRMIVDFFRENHIDLTQEQVSALIESAVQAMNSNTIEVTDYSNTDAIGFNLEDKGDVEAGD